MDLKGYKNMYLFPFSYLTLIVYQTSILGLSCGILIVWDTINLTFYSLCFFTQPSEQLVTEMFLWHKKIHHSYWKALLRTI